MCIKIDPIYNMLIYEDFWSHLPTFYYFHESSKMMTATAINTLGIDSNVVTVGEDSHRSWWFWHYCCGHFKDNSCRPWTMHGHSHIYPFWRLCRTRSLCLSKGKSMSLSKGNQAQVVWYVHTWMPNQQYSLKLKVYLCRLQCLNFT